jgi:hypothetical protein
MYSSPKPAADDPKRRAIQNLSRTRTNRFSKKEKSGQFTVSPDFRFPMGFPVHFQISDIGISMFFLDFSRTKIWLQFGLKKSEKWHITLVNFLLALEARKRQKRATTVTRHSDTKCAATTELAMCVNVYYLSLYLFFWLFSSVDHLVNSRAHLLFWADSSVYSRLRVHLSLKLFKLARSISELVPF